MDRSSSGNGQPRQWRVFASKHFSHATEFQRRSDRLRTPAAPWHEKRNVQSTGRTSFLRGHRLHDTAEMMSLRTQASMPSIRCTTNPRPMPTMTLSQDSRRQTRPSMVSHMMSEASGIERGELQPKRYGRPYIVTHHPNTARVRLTIPVEPER